MARRGLSEKTYAFQSSLPRGERRDYVPANWKSEEISILAPARGATQIEYILGVSAIFQSSLPRGERLLMFCTESPVSEISILAPARGATE